MLSPTVIGVGLHRLELKSNEAKPSWTSTGPKLDFIGVARGDPPQTPIKSIEAKLKSNEAKPSLTSTWPRWTWLKLHEVDQRWLHSRPLSPSPSSTRRSRVELGLGRGGLELKLHEEQHKYIEAKSIEAKLKFNEAKPSWTSTWPRWTWPQCTCAPPSATSVQCWQVGRQVHRGGAEVYLPSLRVNIAVESTMVHRVQLQCNVDELGGKYTEAEPRCTCPPHESTLQRSLWRITECNSNANFTRWKASTPRRSRGVLALPTSQICTKSVKSNTYYRWT